VTNFHIILKNLLHKPLTTTMSIVLLALSTGIISMLLLLQTQLEQKLENDLRDIDLVVGAKGSPLQLVLSAVYHVDAPTGNIPLHEINKLRKSPLVRQITPLAYGDSYRSFRILGTDTTYMGRYGATYASGHVFSGDFEAVIGAEVARQTGLTVGQTFVGTHGEAEEGEAHAHQPYKVTGILQPAYNVLDRLVMTTVPSVWKMHEEGHEAPSTPEKEGDNAGHDHADHKHDDHEGHSHDDHDHADHDHAAAALEDDSTREITAALLRFRSPMAMMSLPRTIQATTSMQAVIPALEINRLLHLMGIGASTLKALALGIMLISGFSVFLTLYNRLRERRYELALLRSMGSSRGRLFALLLGEGIVLAGLGALVGLILSRLGLWWLNNGAARDFHITFSATPIRSEILLVAATVALGLLAALIPAIKAFYLNISKTLADA
jgi:putative ABC transport system permease protein